MTGNLARYQLVLLLIVALLSMQAAISAEPELPDPGTVAGISNEQQVQLGLRAMAEVYKQMPVLPDSSSVSKYVQRLGDRLARVIPPDRSWPYEFHVIQQKDINAFALPGGPIFINLGSILAADNEAELAGVIAHEMSHVYMQHSVKQASKESVAQGLLGIVGGILGMKGGAISSLARMGLQFGAGTLFLKYSRRDEAEADWVGAIIMYKANYDPKALAVFFQKLEEEGGSRSPQFLSDHPNPGNRVQNIQKEIAGWPRKDVQVNSPGFVSAKQAASHVRAYTAQEIAEEAKQGLWAQMNKRTGAIPANLPTAPSDGDQTQQ